MFMKILCGIARTGKSSYSGKLIEDNKTIIISRDKIREMFGNKSNMDNEDFVTSVCQNMLNLSFKNKLNIVIDNTNLKIKYVKPFVELGKKYGYNIEIIRLFLDPESLFNVANQSKFPIEVIENQMKSHNMFEYELLGVPIEDIVINRPEFKQDLYYYIDKMNFNQHNIHHQDTCKTHSMKVVDYIEKNYSDSKYYKELAYAGLFHDIGKPYAIFKETEDNWRYFGHQNVSYLLSKYFNLPNLSCILVALHMDRFSLYNQENIKSYINKIKGYQSYFEKFYNDEEFNFADLLFKIWTADTMSNNITDDRLDNLILKIKKYLDNIPIV